MNLRVQQPLVELDDFERGYDLPPRDEQASFDVASLVRILRARKSVIFGTAGVILAITLVSFAFITQTYSATAVMMLDQRKNAVTDVNAVLSGLPADATSVQNQIQVLTSRELALRVVDKLNLDRDVEFNSSISAGMLGLSGAANASVTSKPAAKEREAAADKLLKKLSVDQVGLSTSMTISVTSVDAEKSARLANAVADTYIEDQVDAKSEATRNATEWLTARVQQVAIQVQGDEAAVQKYKADNGIVDTAIGGSIADQQTVSVNVQLVNAKADLAQKEAIYNRVLQLQRSGRAFEASQVTASPLVAQLRTQEADLARQEAQLATRYLPQHPKMVDLQSQRQDTRRKIGAEAARVIDGLASDVAVARANVESLQASLDQVQSKFQNQNSASVRLKALESMASSSRSIYEGLLSRLKEVQGQEGVAVADTRVISRATPPTVASPRFAMVFGIAIPAALAFGFLFAFVAEGMDPSLRTMEHVDRYLGLPVLATVPEINGLGAGKNPADMVITNPSSSFSESIRGLYLNLALGNFEKSPKVLLVTSAEPGEGKTVVAVSLARLAAKTGRRVIIVDADFRRPSIARTMRLPAPAGGVTDTLDGRLPLERCVVSDARSDAFVLGGVAKRGNPFDLMTSDALSKLVATLRSQYDLVIIDSAPLLPVHDTLLLSELSDTTLFVTHSGKTSREAVTAALHSLHSTKATVAGIALTRAKVDPRSEYQEYLFAGRMTLPVIAPTLKERALAAFATVAGRVRTFALHATRRAN
jgi:polysaccharide biosynthesis transport protein